MTFTKHNVSKVDPSCSMYQYFIPFYGYIINHLKCHILFIYFSVDGHLDYLYCLNVMDNPAIKIPVQVLCGICFHSSWWVCRNGIPGSRSDSIFNYLRNSQSNLPQQLHHFAFQPAGPEYEDSRFSTSLSTLVFI